jgi:PAS domain S-box-containing protein
MDSEGQVIAWNAAAEEIFGWTKGDVIGASMGDLIVPPQHRSSHASGIERYKRTGEGPVLETRVKITALHRDGHEFPVELSIFPMQGENGADSFYAFIRSLKLEEAVRQEQEARAEEGNALLAVAQKLLEDVSLDDFNRFCLATICTVTGMQAGHFQIVRGTGASARLYPSNVWHLADASFTPVAEVTEGMVFRRGEGIPGRAWETGELQVVEDVTAAPVFLRRETFARVGLSRVVALPVTQGGVTHGVLEFFGTSDARLDSDVLRMIQTIGSQIGVALRRKEQSEYRETLRREMSHRVGNSLTVLSSIYRSCSRAAKTKEELDDLYLDRLTAVARASRLAIDRARHDASVIDLIDAAIDIFPDRSGIDVVAPSLVVQSDSVMPLALILHELATNALKHSEIGRGGMLSIRVAVEQATDEVVFDWEETSSSRAGEATDHDGRIGFGTTLMQVMIEDQLAGAYTRHLDDEGLRIVIRIPRVRLEGELDPSTPAAMGMAQ